jgi:hypothetical protein
MKIRERVSKLNIANILGCNYSEFAVQQAIEKIETQVPGLINSENCHIANDIEHWLTDRL